MGYRSEVGYVIIFKEREVYDQFKVQYKLDDKFKHCWEDEANENMSSPTLEFNDDKCFVRFEAYDVKWYDDYPDVICHTDLLDLASEYDEKYKGVEWRFVRIGEEEGDIEDRVGGTPDAVYSYIYPVSSIQFDI